MSGDATVADPKAAREAFLNTDVLFAYNSFTLTEEAKQLLDQKAQWMVRYPQVTIQLEGHWRASASTTT
jgi:peptidoglycan-associated lipoprotein